MPALLQVFLAALRLGSQKRVGKQARVVMNPVTQNRSNARLGAEQFLAFTKVSPVMRPAVPECDPMFFPGFS